MLGDMAEDFESDDGGKNAQAPFTDDSKLQEHLPIVYGAPSVELIRVRTVGNVPRAVTCCFGVPQAPPAAVISGFTIVDVCELVGELEIGIGGNIYRAEIDLVQGVVFSLAVSSLAVRARFSLIPGSSFGLGGIAPHSLDVGAAVAQGIVAGRTPQRTVGWGGALTAGPTVSMPYAAIPAFAKSVQVIGGAPAAAATLLTRTRLDLIIATSGGNVIAHVAVIDLPSQVVPLPAGAAQVSLRDMGDQSFETARLIFDLAL